MRQKLLIIFTLISIKLFSQMSEIISPLIKLNDIEVKFNNVIVFVDEVDKSLIFRDTINLHLNLGETIQGSIFQIIKTGLRDLKVDQQYKTNLSISDEGPHLDLLNWKHFTSDWIEIKPIDFGKYKTIIYSTQDQKRFPDFTENELIDYLISIDNQRYANLIKNPNYSDDGIKHWQIGLSRVTIRISGFDKENKWVARYINFEIPMGC